MLKTSTGFWLARFFSFHHAWITSQEALFSEECFLGRINFKKSPGKAQLNGSGLSADAATRNSDMKIEPGGTSCERKRGGCFGFGSNVSAEIIINGLVID